MKWTTRPWDWKRRFALIPQSIAKDGGLQWVWLDWYWSRFCGDCFETSLQQERPND
jgi:hypothetical protein